jgi:hypothetical protein
MWRVIRLVAGGALLIALGVAGLMTWPLLWPPDPDAAVQLVSGRLLGETTGYVGHVDRDAQTVDVSASLLGFRPIAVRVNSDTAIVVQGRQGGFGDLLKDLPVRVTYEVEGDKRLAKSIEVVSARSDSSAEASLSPATSPPATPTIAPRPVAPPSPATPADAPTRRPPAAGGTPSSTGPAIAAPAQATPPTPANPSVRSPSSAAPRPSAEKSPTAPTAAARVDSPAASAAKVAVPRDSGTPAPALAAPRSRPEAEVSSDPGDGGAAIDWLLNRSRQP